MTDFQLAGSQNWQDGGTLDGGKMGEIVWKCKS